jgi:hypothetical protein
MPRRHKAEEIASFTPHPDIPDSEIFGTQKTVFSIESHPDQKESEFRWGVNAERF